MNKKYLKIVTVLLLLVTLITLCSCSVDYIAFDDSEFVDLKTENNALADGSDIRVMSANVLVHMKSWGGEPVKPRAQLFAEMLKHYLPDVVGMQEVCSDWHKYLTPQISETYEFIKPKQNVFMENRTPMIYNKNTLNLIDSGYYQYSKKDGSRCRAVTYGVFEIKSSGKKFGVTTTHWDFGMEDKKINYRNTQIEELSATINELQSKYNIPVFATGDFNVYEKSVNDGSESYVKFLDVSKTVDIKFISPVRNVVGDKAAYEDESWDHIFMKGAAEVKAFTILAKEYYTRISDHLPIYGDLKIL